LPGVLGKSDEGQTHQWGFGKHKAVFPILSQERFELPFLVTGRETLPVVLPPWQFYTAIDHLKRLIAMLPIERCAQDRVPIDDMLPGTLEH
jgi:hypothetical protein